MNRKQVRSFVKKLTAGMLAVGIAAVGIFAVSNQVDAAEVPDTVIYDEAYEIADYWSNAKTAPVKEGYVFGGWFQDAAEGTKGAEQLTSAVDGTTKKTLAPLTPEIIDTDADGTIDFTGTAYAKFVPAQVLSVKAQNMADTIASTEKTYVRVISSLDSANYDRVGFDIWLGNAVQLYKDNESKAPLETTRIYKGLLVGTEKVTANKIFGGVSEYVSVWQLTNIANVNFNKIIYVRPYWYTKDGTKVEGLAKYVHIEDEYKGYISVPVNIYRTRDIAAGIVNMSYNEGLQLAEDGGNVLFEEGRIFPEMAFDSDATNRTIRMMGNEATADIYENSEETIYANIRFKKPTTDTDVELIFDMALVKFCDWTEYVLKNDIEVKVWDIAYEIKTQSNTNQ